jgi:hypothetical protein
MRLQIIQACRSLRIGGLNAGRSERRFILGHWFLDAYFTTVPPKPSFFRAAIMAASSYSSVSAVKFACLRSKFTCTFFAHGKVASASRTRGGQPIGQVIPVTSTVTSLVPAAGSPFWSACF